MRTKKEKREKAKRRNNCQDLRGGGFPRKVFIFFKIKSKKE